MGQSPALAVLTRAAKPPGPASAGPMVTVAGWGVCIWGGSRPPLPRTGCQVCWSGPGCPSLPGPSHPQCLYRHGCWAPGLRDSYSAGPGRDKLRISRSLSLTVGEGSGVQVAEDPGRRRGPGRSALSVFCLWPGPPQPHACSPWIALLVLTLYFPRRAVPWGSFPAEKGQMFRLPSALNR